MPDPVLIIGAGPTGLTAALELSRFGVPVRIVDKLAEPATTSRAIGVQARTLELLDKRGLADEMVRLGNPASGGSIYGNGARLFRLDFSGIESRFPYILMLSQAETERILTEAIARQGVTIERGVELVALSEDVLSHDASPVKAVLRHADERLELAAAPWLISAEGAHSRVRTTLDLRFEGKTLPDDFALGDLHVAADLVPTDFHIFSSEHGFLGLFPLGGAQFRLIASHSSNEPNKDAPPSLEEQQAIYDHRSHIPARLSDLAWSSWFRINSRMVTRLVAGRLLLGGDAAHIHSPAGAQGMNTGIQDMINLGWKLAFVMQGKAQPALLRTYKEDRIPVMRTVLTRTEGMTGIIGSENPVFRTLFNHLAPWIGGSGFVQEIATARLSQIALGYRTSSLSETYGHGELHAGDRLPEDTLARVGAGPEERPLFTVLDPSRFVLLAITVDGSVPEDLADAVRPWAGLVQAVGIAVPAEERARVRFESLFGKYGGVFVVRPDSYLGVVAGDHPAAAHLTAYFTKWLGPREQAHSHSEEHADAG